jgi:hypothetical protein
MNIQLGCNAILQPELREVQRLFLKRGIFPARGNKLLQLPDGDVCRRNIPSERHQRIIIGRQVGVQVGFGGLNVPADLAPDVNFPRRVKSCRNARDVTVHQTGALKVADDRILRAEPDVLRVPFQLLDLWKQLAARDAELGARLVNPDTRRLQLNVLAVGLSDQAIQRFILENMPPRHGGSAAGRKAGAVINGEVCALAPTVEHRRLGALKIRTDHTSGKESGACKA